MNQPSKQKISLDVNFVNPFIQGTLKTLEVQCSVKAKAGAPVLKSSTSVPESEITAVIGLTSATFNGSIAISFPAQTFLSIMGKMLGDEFKEISKDLEDGASELMNIIFGQAKLVLNEKGYAIEKAIPTIVRGKSLIVRHLTPSASILLPFTSDAGVFHIEIAVEPTSVK